MTDSVTAKASARKSMGEFKALIVFSNGRTEVVEQSDDRRDRNTRHGMVKGNRYARGRTYKTREEAVAAAQAAIDARLEIARQRFADFQAHNAEKGMKAALSEIQMWGG